MKKNNDSYVCTKEGCVLYRDFEKDGEVYTGMVSVEDNVLTNEVKQVLQDKMEEELNKV